MTDDKQTMQADGCGTEPRMIDENGELASRRGEGQPGESGGGPYRNPHSGKKPGNWHGGQTEQAYHGAGQLGEQKTAEQPNAGSRQR
jgi:hypothetical protein